VVFHDGTEFDGADVEYTFERIPSSDSPLASALGTLVDVEVLSDLRVVFHFSERAVDFPLLLTDRRMRILSSESEAGVGTGPFSMVDFDPRNTSRLAAFDEYWQGAPGLAGVEIVARRAASA